MYNVIQDRWTHYPFVLLSFIICCQAKFRMACFFIDILANKILFGGRVETFSLHWEHWYVIFISMFDLASAPSIDEKDQAQ